MATLTWGCTCGQVRGTARDIHPGDGARAVCMCADCQAFLTHLGREDLLDRWRGTDVFPITPDRLTLESGHEHLRCLRLSDKGMFRFYAACCHTPLGNTLGPKVPFVGVPTAALRPPEGQDLDQVLGPVRARMQAHAVPNAPPEAGHQKAPLSIILRSIAFMARAALGRRHQPSPFRSADGTLRVAPRVLTPTERAALG
jgi:hypothetical protein